VNPDAWPRNVDERSLHKRLARGEVTEIGPQLRGFLAWYEEVLGRIEAGAVVAPGEQERLTEEASAVAHFLDLLDSSENSVRPALRRPRLAAAIRGERRC